MFQPRLGIAYDVHGDNKTLLRGSAGIYYARIPGLNLAGTRSTNGSRGQSIFRSSALTPVLGPPPTYGELLPSPTGDPFRPNIFVFDKNFKNPRTISTHCRPRTRIACKGGSRYLRLYILPHRQSHALCQPQRRGLWFSLVNGFGSQWQQRHRRLNRRRKHRPNRATTASALGCARWCETISSSR